MEWAQAYSALANEGKMLSLYGIEKITTFDNVVIYENTANYKYVASSDDIYILNEAMTNIFDYQVSISIRPTGASIANKLNYTYAAKSGSTDSDYWMIGYTPNFLCLVWIGDDNNEKITNKKDMLAAKYIWADIIETYFKDHEYLWYETPTNILAYDLDPITGFYPSFNSYHKLLYFKKDNLPWYLRF
jgi:membrane peptidoglycan carboxypeptidase